MLAPETFLDRVNIELSDSNLEKCNTRNKQTEMKRNTIIYLTQIELR